MSYKRLIVLAVAVMLIVCLSAFYVYAEPPVRVQFLAAIYDSGSTTTANRTLNIDPVSNNIFGLSSDEILASGTRMYLWFRTDASSVRTFRITLKILSSGYEFNTTANNKAYMRLCRISTNSNGSIGIDQNVAIGDQTDITIDGSSITYEYLGSETNRNGVLLVMTFQSCVLGSTPMYIQVTEMSVNGYEQGEIPVTETAAETEDLISQLHNNELEMWSQIVAPVLSDSFNDQQINEAMTQSGYYSLLTSVSMNNFIVPAMLLIVATMAFYSYAIFGRKG